MQPAVAVEPAMVPELEDRGAGTMAVHLRSDGLLERAWRAQLRAAEVRERRQSFAWADCGDELSEP
jgi:hypothetical protein